MATRSAWFRVICLSKAWFGLLCWIVLSWNVTIFGFSDYNSATIHHLCKLPAHNLFHHSRFIDIARNCSIESIQELIYCLIRHSLALGNIRGLIDLWFDTFIFTLFCNLINCLSTSWILLESLLSLSRIIDLRNSDYRSKFWAMTSPKALITFPRSTENSINLESTSEKFVII